MGRVKGEELIKKKIKVLAYLELHEGNVAKTSRDMKVARSTIRIWRNFNAPLAAKLKAEKEQRRLEAEQKQEGAIAEDVDRLVTLTQENLEKLAGELLEEIRIKMPTARFSELGVTFGIVYDKSRIHKGQASVISQTIGNLSDEERAKRAEELLAKGRQRRLNAGGQAMAIVPNPGEGNGNGTTG